MPKEQYMCQLCANHGIFNQPKKGHKQKCPHRLCPCSLCGLNTKRRRLDQIERQLRTTVGSGEDDYENPTSATPPSSTTSTVPFGQNLSLIPMKFFEVFEEAQKLKEETLRSCKDTVAIKKIDAPGRFGNTMRQPSSAQPYCIPVPATIGQPQGRHLKRGSHPMSPESQAERRRRTELFEETLARITAKKASNSSVTSIFHSVKMLAEPG